MQDDADMSLLLEEKKQLQRQNTILMISLSHYLNRKDALEKAEHEKAAIMDILDKVAEQIIYMDPDMKIVYANNMAGELARMPPEQMVGRRCYEVLQGRDEPCPHCIIRQVIATNQPQVGEKVALNGRVMLSRGYPIHNKAGKLVGIVEMGLDINKYEQVEEALRVSEERFAKAFHSSPCMMTIVSCLDSRYIDVNETFLSLTGFTRDEVIEHHGEALGWGWRGLSDEAKSLLVNRIPFKNLEVTVTKRSGQKLTALLSVEIIVINQEPCFLCVGIDITERKIIEEEMARLDRLNLIGQAAASIAHEIRNPMTVVRGYLQLLRGKKEYASDKQRFNVMIEELDRANMIITEFLSLAKNNPVELERHNINNILINLLPLIKAEAMKTGKIVSILFGNLPELDVDEKQIRQIVLNLAQNGLEAMPGKGVLTIKTDCDGDEVVLSVKDQGEGIGPEVLEKVGTPFFTTKKNGTGIGLAVCYRIAERHNAKIDIKTGPGGTTFMVRFKKRSPLSNSPS